MTQTTLYLSSPTSPEWNFSAYTDDQPWSALTASLVPRPDPLGALAPELMR